MLTRKGTPRVVRFNYSGFDGRSRTHQEETFLMPSTKDAMKGKVHEVSRTVIPSTKAAFG